MSTWPRAELKSLLRDLFGWAPSDELDDAVEAILQLVMPEDEIIEAPPGTWQNYIGRHGVAPRWVPFEDVLIDSEDFPKSPQA